ncbi:MAG: hypothetical protein IKI35_05730 [Stomatobaculum sp.]|nr:hypothetical protein [Stomatobaculum sp.]
MDVVTYALLAGKVSGISRKYGSLAEGFDYKGSAASVAALPSTGNTAGDVYTVAGAGNARYLWTGSEWVNLDDQIAQLQQALGNLTMDSRVTSLDGTALSSDKVIEAVGSPVYVDDLTEYPAYGLTETGWYIFARIAAPGGVTVGANASVTGAAGVIMAEGTDHVDVAVKFEVAAVSQEVTVSWGTVTETFVFKATDLAIRNLDYRVTFYVYDIAPFCTWEYERSTDPLFVGTKYFTEANGVYTQAAVKAYEQVPADTYYTHAYVQAEDEVFQAGVTYYTLAGGIYTPAEVTPGDPLAPEGVDPAPVYYVDQWTLTTDTQFVGTRYFAENDGTYEQIAVKAGEPCSYYIKVITYPLPGTTSFVGTEYWTPDESDLGYARAAVLAGEDIPEGEYFTHTYTKLTAAGKFAEGVRYYKLVDTEYVLQTVTVGASYAKNVYYIDTWTAAEGKFAGTAYYLEQDGQYVQVPVYGGEEIPAAYYTRQVQYTLTEDVVFAAGKTYYTRSGSEYAEAEVTAGDEVPAGTYYEQTISWPKATGLFMDGVTYYTAPAGVYTEAVVVPGEAIPDLEYCVQLISWPQVTDDVFEDNVTYYTLISEAYIEADVTTGEAVPENLVHSKLTIEGMTRNITYQCPTPIDCPVEFILPAIEDETHGAWFECRFRFMGAYSITLTVPTGVKVATEHTQKEKAGINMVDLHYTNIDGVKLWRFLNTASSIPA